jgi:pimeloyl-ACP methyl ester carboxylesterase
MVALWRRWLQRWQAPSYVRRPPVILVNGLAEQPETWFRNVACWRRDFEVHLPNLITYEGDTLHCRIREGNPITIDYLVEQLHQYLVHYVQTPPFHLVANSMGGKVAVEFAVRYPEMVSRLVLLCPSGIADDEPLPIVDGVRRSNMQSVVHSVFYDASWVPPDLVTYYLGRVKSRRWRLGLLRTIRDTMAHRVKDLLPHVVQPTLIVVGRDDRIVDPRQAIAAAKLLPRGRLVVLPRCGHAPQIEAARTINRLVADFLQEPDQAVEAAPEERLEVELAAPLVE